MVIIGVTFDVCNLWRISGEMKKEDSAGTVCFHCSTLPQILNAKVHMYTSKNAQTICYKSVIKLSTNCIRTACSHFFVTSLEHAVNNFKKAYLVCIIKVFARFFQQVSYLYDIALLYHDGIRLVDVKLVRSLVTLTELQYDVDELFQTCQQHGTSSGNTNF